MDRKANQDDKLQVTITAKQVLNVALKALDRELKKEPFSPDRVAALAEVIKVLKMGADNQ